MKRQKITIGYSQVLLIVIGICLMTVLTCLIRNGANNLRRYDDYAKLEQGWMLEDADGTQKITLPSAYHHNTMEPFSLTYTFQGVGDGEEHDLYVVAYYCDMNIYLDGQLYDSYAFSKTFSYHTSGSGYLLFSMPKDLEGHTITLEYIPQIKLHTYRLTAPLYGNRGDITIYLFKSRLLDTLLNMVLIIIGIVLIATGIFFRHYGHRSGQILLGLGFFASICGAYLEVRMEWLRLLVQNPLSIYQIEFLLQLLIMLPILLMLHKVYYGRSLKLLEYCISINVVHTCVQYLLYFCTPLELKSMILFSHIVLASSIVLVAYITFIRKEILPGYQKEITYSIMPVGFFGILDIILYYVNRTAQSGVLLKIGVIIFLIMEIYYNLKHYKEYELEEQQNRIYREIALKDILTGLKNRNAYEQDICELEGRKEECESIAVGVFDLNQLKQVNDSMGHGMGDRLIKSMAQILQQVFGQIAGVYRTGGDEFIVLFVDITDREITKLCDILEIEGRNCFVTADIVLSYSYGVAKYDPQKHGDLQEMVGEADASMYEAKKKYHTQLNEE